MHGATIKMTQQYLYVSDYYPFKEELQVESYIILNSYRAVNTFHLGYKNCHKAVRGNKFFFFKD